MHRCVSAFGKLRNIFLIAFFCSLHILLLYKVACVLIAVFCSLQLLLVWDCFILWFANFIKEMLIFLTFTCRWCVSIWGTSK